ncbi:MAG: hypothetical protein NVSMB27_05620 [Ktedonobacteraceae bacterium]
MTNWSDPTETGLLSLIANQEMESHYLDFKDRRSLLTQDKSKRRQELGKDVSSFAHADGGTIIYGMEEEGKPGIAKRIQGFSPEEMTKETLTQLVQASTYPPIHGVRIHPVALTQSDPGNWAYVVTVSQATMPYQAEDMKFHRRDNATTRAMFHEEIFDVQNRARGPKLALRLAFNQAELETTFTWANDLRQSDPVTLSAYVHNAGKIALYSQYRLYVATNVPDIVLARLMTWHDEDTSTDPPGMSNEAQYRKLQVKMVVPTNPPVFASDIASVGTLFLRVHQQHRAWSDYMRMYWECVAPDMVSSHGGVTVQRAAMTLQVKELPDDDVQNFFGP